jgi:hypothetical protein
MEFTNKQLQKMGEVTEDLFRGEISVEPTNLHEGSTIVMRGRSSSGSNVKLEILVTGNGQTADLSRLSRGVLEKV